MSTQIPKRLDLKSTDDRTGVVADSRRIRPLYFDGKFLTAADLNREQAYLITRQADLARSLGFGVVDGLRTERSDRTASEVAGAAASLRITAGHGLTPSGEVVVLPADTIVDLSDVPRLEGLNASFGLARRPQPPFYNLSGLFVVGLRAVEFTANPTPVFPPGLQGSQSLQDGEIIEATAITLVPYESAAAVNDAPKARARVAREIFLEQRPPKLPAGVLPLAMLYLRGGFLQWVDEFLVRREAGDHDRFGFGFAPRALAEAHFYHYREMLDDVPAPARQGRIAAVDFFEVLPPGGPLPVGTVDFADFTQAFFPPEARVELTLVPDDELAGLMEECLVQPPMDLRIATEDSDALAILLLAPVPRASFREAVQQLTELRPVLRHVAPAMLSRQRPLQALHRLNDILSARKKSGEVSAPTAAELEAPIADAAWAKVLGPVPTLWYVRRRNLPYASELASNALPATTPPAILLPPQSVLASSGESVIFRVTAIGSAPLGYQWRKSGAPIDGATGSELEFASIVAGDAALYDVTVTNDSGAVTSAPATIALRQLPVIASHPVDLNTTLREDATFEVIATGSAPLRYQWRKDGADIEGATQARLVLEEVAESDAGDYDVRASNYAGTVTSNVATLTIELIRAPTISGQPESVSTQANTSVSFRVAATGTAPLTFQWRHNTTSINGATRATLVLNDVSSANAGDYDVVVSNSAGTVTSATAVLAIESAPTLLPPTITAQPQSVIAFPGTTVHFNVGLAGTAPLQLQWRMNGQPLTGGNAASSTLVLSNVQPPNAGTYDIVVSNAAGSATSAAANLTIEGQREVGPPAITTQPRDVIAPIGSSVVLQVGITGTAPFRFQWRFNGHEIPDATGISIVLNDVTEASSGRYDVSVANDGGEVTSDAATVRVTSGGTLEIRRQPRSVTAVMGKRAGFVVTAQGTPMLSFQWFRSESATGTREAIPGANDATLRFAAVTEEHIGFYQVEVSNGAGMVQTSDVVSLTIRQ